MNALISVFAVEFRCNKTTLNRISFLLYPAPSLIVVMLATVNR